ncbi:MAG: Holin [Eubacteriales bacterium]|jgi:hypothetical protein
MNFASVVFVILLAVFLSIRDIPEMKRKKEYKEMVIYVIFLFFGIMLTILKASGADLANPSDVVVAINSPFVSKLEGILG